MILDFKNNFWKSISRILLCVMIILIIVLIFFDLNSSFRNFDFLAQKEKSNITNFYVILIFASIVISILIANSFFDEKYIFKLSNLLISLLIFILIFPLLMFTSVQFSMGSKIDFLFKTKIEMVDRKSFLEDGVYRTYEYIIENDTVYYSNHNLYGNKDKIEYNILLNGEIYKTLWKKNYLIKINEN